jgi:hypothetical protein
MRRVCEYAAGFVLVLSIGIGFAGAVGAASQKQPVHQPKALTKQTPGKRFLALLKPANVATNYFITAAGSWSSSTTLTQAEAGAQAVIKTFEIANHRLITDHWPASARFDVNTVAAADAVLIGDLEGFSHLDMNSTWLSNFQRAVSHFSAAVAIVRHDLGLPSSSAS